MKKKIIIGSIIAVVLLILVSFTSVVGKVSSDEEMVEFEVEFSGLGKKHTVKLTQQEYEEFELFFDDIEQQLSEVETRAEAEVIFKEAVIELDKYGVLGGISVEKVQRLITSKYLLPTNIFCLIVGELTNIDYFKLPFFIFGLIGLAYFWHIFSSIFHDINPLKMHTIIAIGHYSWSFEGPTYYSPSEGWIATIGLLGLKHWEGKIQGNIDEITYQYPYGGSGYKVGIKGFIGIQIKNLLTDVTYLLGIGRKVDIKYSNW